MNKSKREILNEISINIDIEKRKHLDAASKLYDYLNEHKTKKEKIYKIKEELYMMVYCSFRFGQADFMPIKIEKKKSISGIWEYNNDKYTVNFYE